MQEHENLLTLPGDARPSRLLTLDVAGRLLSAELGPLPGDRAPQRMSAEESAAWRRAHKVYQSAEHPVARGAGTGEEFKPFWQPQAEQALAAIRRQMSGGRAWQRRPTVAPLSAR